MESKKVHIDDCCVEGTEVGWTSSRNDEDEKLLMSHLRGLIDAGSITPADVKVT